MRLKLSNVLPAVGVVLLTLAFCVQVSAASFPWHIGPDHSGVDGLNQNDVNQAYLSAAIVGFDKDKQDASYEASLKVEVLEAENEALQDTVFDLTLRVQKLEKLALQLQETAQTGERVVYVSQPGEVSVPDDIEHRLHVVERAVSMNEVTIGSTHAYINEQLDPILRALGLR